MKFVELTKDICVNRDKIDFIKSENGGSSCVVIIAGKEFNCYIPYRTLMDSIKQGDNDATLDKLNKYLSVATVQQV